MKYILLLIALPLLWAATPKEDPLYDRVEDYIYVLKNLPMNGNKSIKALEGFLEPCEERNAIARDYLKKWKNATYANHFLLSVNITGIEFLDEENAMVHIRDRWVTGNSSVWQYHLAISWKNVDGRWYRTIEPAMVLSMEELELASLFVENQ